MQGGDSGDVRVGERSLDLNKRDCQQDFTSKVMAEKESMVEFHQKRVLFIGKLDLRVGSCADHHEVKRPSRRKKNLGLSSAYIAHPVICLWSNSPLALQLLVCGHPILTDSQLGVSVDAAHCPCIEGSVWNLLL